MCVGGGDVCACVWGVCVGVWLGDGGGGGNPAANLKQQRWRQWQQAVCSVGWVSCRQRARGRWAAAGQETGMGQAVCRQ